MLKSDELVAFLSALSRLLGWSYVFCWSLSFYPQPRLNWRRRSVVGLTPDFPILNVLGFVAYTITTSAFLFSPTIRAQYAYRHPASPEPTVRFNDFVFAVHALLLCAITYSQFFPCVWGFAVGKRQRSSRVVLGIVYGSAVAVVSVMLLVMARGRDSGSDASRIAWIDLIYSFGYIKLIATFVKYMPQAYLNYQNQSTVGWSIGQILLDFSGSIMSLLQLIIDSSLQADWSGVLGNPVKFGLGNIGIFFDVIFMVQHYVLYRHPSHKKQDADWGGEEEPLITSASIVE